MNMDESLVLSDKKKGKTLSAGKKCSKKGVRYALRSPHDNVWPIIDESNEQLLKEFLKSLLLPASKKSSTSKEMRDHLILGVNMLTRSLEKGEVCCALLDSTFNPKFGISHICSMCPLKEVPLLVVPNLRQVVCNALGFPCVALGFKKYVADSKNNHFHPIYDMVIQMLPTTLSVEPSILGFKPSFLRVQSSDIRIPIEEDDDSSSDSDIFAPSCISTVEHDAKQSQETNRILHLHRTSKKERTFTFDQLNISKPMLTSHEFISLNSKDDVMPSLKLKPCNKKPRKLRDKGSTFSLPPGTRIPNSSKQHTGKFVKPFVVLRPNKIRYLSARVERILPNPNKQRKPKRKLVKQNLKKHS